jgi:hypothetical protein
MEKLIKKLKTELFFNQEELSESFTYYSHLIHNDLDRLTVLIHLIMIQANFKYNEQTSHSCENISFMNIHKGSFYNKLAYNKLDYSHTENNEALNDKLESDLIIVLIRSGKSVDLNLKFNKFESSFMKINLNDEFTSQTIKSMIIQFRNKILNPFKFHYSKISNKNLIYGLLDMPIEIIYKLVLNYLDIRSIIALQNSSKHLYRILSVDQPSQFIWKRLLFRDFKIDTNLATESYRKKYIYHHKQLE